jgi:hypothetical protein
MGRGSRAPPSTQNGERREADGAAGDGGGENETLHSKRQRPGIGTKTDKRVASAQGSDDKEEVQVQEECLHTVLPQHLPSVAYTRIGATTPPAEGVAVLEVWPSQSREWRLGRSPLGERTGQSPTRRGDEDFSPRSVHRRHHLEFNSDNVEGIDGGTPSPARGTDNSQSASGATEVQSGIVDGDGGGRDIVSLVCPVHDTGVKGGSTALRPARAEVLPQHSVQEETMTQAGQDSGVEVPPNETAVDVSESNTLQHLHNLIRTLNPEEREVFLGTHNFFDDVGSGSPSRRRGDDGGRGEVPRSRQRSPAPSTIGEQGRRAMPPLQQQSSPGSRSAREVRTGIRRDSAADGMDGRGKAAMPEDGRCELTEQRHRRSQHTGNMRGGGREKAASLQMGRGAAAKAAPHPTASKAEELREMLQRVDDLRRELKATEECCTEGGVLYRRRDEPCQTAE